MKFNSTKQSVLSSMLILGFLFWGSNLLHAEAESVFTSEESSAIKASFEKLSDTSDLEAKSDEIGKRVEELRTQSSELSAKLSEYQNEKMDDSSRSLMKEINNISDSLNASDKQQEELSKKLAEVSAISEKANSENELKNIEIDRTDIQNRLNELSKYSSELRAESDNLTVRLNEIQLSQADEATRSILDEKASIDKQLRDAISQQAEIKLQLDDARKNGRTNPETKLSLGNDEEKIDALAKGEGIVPENHDGASEDQHSGSVTSGSESQVLESHGSSQYGFATAAPGAPAPPLTACLAFAGVLLLQTLRQRKAA